MCQATSTRSSSCWKVLDNEKAKGKAKKGWGGLSSSAEDFLHFEQMLLNGGELLGTGC